MLVVKGGGWMGRILWRGVGGTLLVIAVDTTLDFLNHKRDNKISCMNYNYDT